MKKQRLILLFDGTWNDPEDSTNVFRIAGRIRNYDGEIRQRFFYDPGVGTERLNKFTGGLFGFGLSRNLMDGYDWLARKFNDGDEIWIFGFSRGAYTARSLVGLLRKCGLLKITTPRLLEKAEELYRNKDLLPDASECVSFRANYSSCPRVRFVGVWDTVGSLGVPGTRLSEHGFYSWHDTELSSIVDYAYHAVALDEYRAAYNASLWTSESGKKKPENLDVEQRWFIGAHANIGGGYGAHDLLADISLSWMIEKASWAGLKLDAIQVNPEAWRTTPRDSYGEFLGGGYAWFRAVKAPGKAKHFRVFDKGFNGKAAVNVTVDESVWCRWMDSNLHYRPPTLVDARQSPP